MVPYVDTKWGRWTPEAFKLLKDGYAKAVAEGAEVFDLRGQTVLVRFAQYLIEFLEGEGLRER